MVFLCMLWSAMNGFCPGKFIDVWNWFYYGGAMPAVFWLL